MLRTSNQRRKNTLSDMLKNVNLFKVIVVLFFLGLVYGAVLVSFSNKNIIESLSVLTQQFIDKRSAQSIVYTFFGSFGSSILLLSCLFISGFCAIGQPIAFFIPIFHGLGLGISMAYLYSDKGWQGLLFCLILIIPSAIVSTFAMFLASRESIRFSNRLFRQLFPQRWESEISGALRLYCIRFFVLIALEAGSALIDTICTFLFAGFFE